MTERARAAVIYITQGEQAIGRRDFDVIATTLGSCIAVCLWDPVAGVGGMNHVLLPEVPPDRPSMGNVGAAAMDRLVNALLKAGADRSRLRAKLFGGASMIAGFSDIGQRNAAFAKGWLVADGIPCESESTGGRLARQIRFWPATGRAQMKLVDGVADPVTLPKRPEPETGTVDLF